MSWPPLPISAKVLSTANFSLDVERAAALLERARQLAHAIGDRPAEAKISWTLLLNNTMSGGDVAERIEHGERALKLALELDERELLAFIYNDLWFAYAGAGRWSDAIAGLAAGREICRQLGHLPTLCENLTRAALSHLAIGRYDEALVDMDEAYRVAESANSADFRGLARAFEALIHQDRGDLGRAIEVAEAAIAWGEQSGNVTVLIGSRSDLARTYAFLGDFDTALALANQALDVAANRFPLMVAWPQCTLARLHLLRGEAGPAAAILAGAVDYRVLQQGVSFIVPMWGNMGLANVEVALAQRQYEPAEAHAAELVQRLGDCSIRFLLPEARLRLAEALLGQGRLDEAGAALLAARGEAEALGSRRLLWPILEALAEAAQRAGSPASAAALRAEARPIVEYFAARAPTPRLRERFLATPRARALLAADDHAA